MVLQLPDEIWQSISDWLQSSALGFTCGRLFNLLQFRHVFLDLTSPQPIDKLSHLGAVMHRLVTLRLRCPPHDNHHCTAIRLIADCARNAIVLESLWVELLGTDIQQWPQIGRAPAARFRTEVAHILGPFQLAPNLRFLTVHLEDEELSSTAIRALTALKEWPALTTLSLCLVGKALHGERHLELLGASQIMRKLNIELAGMVASPVITSALVAASSAAGLRQLTLSLAETRLSSAAVERLTGLCDRPTLERLSLDLSNNAIGDRGAIALASFRDSPFLKVLDLNVSRNGITSAGIERLMAIRESPSLEALRLNLVFNTVCPSAVCTLHNEPPGALQYIRLGAQAASGLDWSSPLLWNLAFSRLPIPRVSSP